MDPANTGTAAAFAGRVGIHGQPFTWMGGGPGLHVRAKQPTDTAVVYIGDQCSEVGAMVGYLGFTAPNRGVIQPNYGPYAGIRAHIVETGQNARGRLVFETHEPLSIPMPPPDMCIESNGFVGIRVDKALARLHLGGQKGVDGIMFPDGTLQTTAAAGGTPAWNLTGNGGTTPGTHFVGTIDNQALQLHVNNQCALRIEPHATSPNVIGGHGSNSVGGAVYGAAIGGGGKPGYPNQVNGDLGFVGAGQGNQVATLAAIAGGDRNIASGYASFIGGGGGNTAEGDDAVVGGGWANKARHVYTTIGGGVSNEVAGEYGTIGGGHDNTIGLNAQYAFIGGGETNTVPAGVRYAVVSGGQSNTASGLYSAVGGGEMNTAAGTHAVVGGGFTNRATARATVSGGEENVASAEYATVVGGFRNTASADFSFAAGFALPPTMKAALSGPIPGWAGSTQPVATSS